MLIYKYSFFILILLVLTFQHEPMGAQCLQPNLYQGVLLKSTGNTILDQKFNNEGNELYSIFGVNPNIFLFDDGNSPNAFASPQNTTQYSTGTVYFGLHLLVDELWSMDKGEAAVSGIMAHEFAHILQIQRNSRLTNTYRELHADYMAGYYLARKGYLGAASVAKFANSLFQKGDYQFFSMSHHGTPQERVAAMLAGFRAGREPLDEAFAEGETYVTVNNNLPGAGEPVAELISKPSS